MCFAPQRRALFWQVNFQKRSDTEVLYTFWLQNVLRATTTCTFSTSQFLPREPGTWKTVGPVKTAGVLQQKHEGCLKGIPPSTYLRIIKVLFRHPLSSTKKIIPRTQWDISSTWYFIIVCTCPIISTGIHKKPFIIPDIPVIWEKNPEGVSFEAASHGSNFLGQACPANRAWTPVTGQPGTRAQNPYSYYGFLRVKDGFSTV